ncbi:hypothetical protein COO91_01941 [Nostoc flagelliforme CCNUN1]|uniref:Uncharacterized protein n=1 Tax=Nostoc flagelliforme CCNUN1 TaxID=2038116 RepID=A0A2K8SKS3_9NOSO|nr:hypothetical protein [Nostoc flagelliforme]AUB36042.1 hypothetical protein COO91_01941 [Nostoc flagelliforme CCNUN1]
MIHAKTKVASEQMTEAGVVFKLPAGEEVFVDYTTPQTELKLCQCYWNGEIVYLTFDELEMDLPSIDPTES